jgi:phosphoribosylamine--glycine ligase
MRILLVGNGAREHALAWAISASPLCDALYCAPGNAGIAELATCIDIPADAVERLVAFAKETGIDFVIVGPEAPLVLGLVDALEAAGIKAFGPSAAAARLEGSKGFMKDLCARHTIPTAPYARFTDGAAAKAYVEKHGAPIVVKADGLAAGKGVTVAETQAEAFAAIDEAFSGRFGAAGSSLVIEGFLAGEEVSFFALVDGKTALPLASAQDHKRVGEGDTGPNTGGMGAYSPAPIMTEALTARVMAEIIEPTVAGMAAEGMPFKGVLFAGLMILDTADGKVPYLLEYNTRFGDPECEVLMRRLKSDLLPALIAARDGVLDHFHLRWRDEAALCVVMAAKGYPGTPQKGGVIGNLAEAAAVEGVTVFHAGTRFDAEGRVIADGGRVLCVTATGTTLGEARDRAYRAVDRIAWAEGFCRRDIGWRALPKRD